jgi:hypothetical protein
MILGGLSSLAFFGWYETKISPIPLLPPRLLRNPTILWGSVLGFSHFASQFCCEYRPPHISSATDHPCRRVLFHLLPSSRPRTLRPRRLVHLPRLHLLRLYRRHRRGTRCQVHTALQVDRHHGCHRAHVRDVLDDEDEESRLADVGVDSQSGRRGDRRGVHDDCRSDRLSGCRGASGYVL